MGHRKLYRQDPQHITMLKVATLCMVLAGVATVGAQNNTCYTPNRFEYEYSVLAKLLEFEHYKMNSGAKINAMEQQLAGLLLSGNTSVASAYVHWGLSSCPNVAGTTLVYSGQAAGGHSNHTGSGEYVCLPNDPQYGQYNTWEDGQRSLIFGAEYETNGSPVYTELNNFDVPCSVCLAQSAATLMIPGRTSCYSGWKKAYQGYLMGEQYNNHGKGYVCMDQEAEAMSSSFSDANGALFYLVEGRCGTLKCPPYFNGRELACVVCSR